MNNKKMLFIAALHGDEILGVEVLQRLEKELPPQKYRYDWVIGNPKALSLNKRFTEVDLNRCAPGEHKGKCYEERRAHELIRMSRNYACVIDIHGTVSESGIFSLITNPTLDNFLLADILETNKAVVWVARSSLAKGPVTQHCLCPAIEIECGPKTDPTTKNKLYKIIREFILKVEAYGICNFISHAHKKNWFLVYGKGNRGKLEAMKDFQETFVGEEMFFPLLVNKTRVPRYYKMKKLDFFNLLSY